MARHKDASWSVSDKPQTWEEVAVAVLMDIRDEMKLLRGEVMTMSARVNANLDATRRIDKRLAKKTKLVERT